MEINLSCTNWLRAALELSVGVTQGTNLKKATRGDENDIQ